MAIPNSHIYITDPLICTALECTILLLVLSFASRDSVIRPAVLPVIALLAYYSLPSNQTSRKIYSVLLTANALGAFLHYLDVVLSSRWTFEAQGPTSIDGGQYKVNPSPVTNNNTKATTEVWARLRFGFKTTFAFRLPGTPWEVKNVPQYSPHDRAFGISKARFLCTTFFALAICLLILDLSSYGAPPHMFLSKRIALFGRPQDFSLEEVMTRSTVSFISWLITYCVLQSVYCLLAINSVSCGLTGVETWRPLFGPLRQCWSVRQFWGTFWHQSMRTRLATPANLVTYSMLRLRKGSFAARYTSILLTFLVSGVLHALLDLTIGVPFTESGAVQFYCLQAIGIMLEDGVQFVFHRLTRNETRTMLQPKGWTRMVGYLWLVAWMTWCAPIWFYPGAMRNKGEERDHILPFSFLGLFIERK